MILKCLWNGQSVTFVFNLKTLEINLILNHVDKNTHNKPFAERIVAEECSIERKKIGDSRKMCDVIEFDNDATVNVMALYEARWNVMPFNSY